MDATGEDWRTGFDEAYSSHKQAGKRLQERNRLAAELYRRGVGPDELGRMIDAPASVAAGFAETGLAAIDDKPIAPRMLIAERAGALAQAITDAIPPAMRGAALDLLGIVAELANGIEKLVEAASHKGSSR